MVTFAVEVPEGEDVGGAEEKLVDRLNAWMYWAILFDGPHEVSAITVERHALIKFGNDLTPDEHSTLLEAKVEVDE